MAALRPGIVTSCRILLGTTRRSARRTGHSLVIHMSQRVCTLWEDVTKILDNKADNSSGGGQHNCREEIELKDNNFVGAESAIQTV